MARTPSWGRGAAEAAARKALPGLSGFTAARAPFSALPTVPPVQVSTGASYVSANCTDVTPGFPRSSTFTVTVSPAAAVWAEGVTTSTVSAARAAGMVPTHRITARSRLSHLFFTGVSSS